MPTAKISQILYNGDVLVDFYPNSHRYKFPDSKTYLISVTASTGIIDKSTALVKWATELSRDSLINLLEQGKVITREDIFSASTKHTEKKEEAGGFGSQVHDYAEKFAQAQIRDEDLPDIEDDAPLEVINGISAFLDWVTSHEVKFISAERLVYSKRHEYVGFCDAVALVDGVLSVIDYKTSKRIYSSHHYQAAAYALAISEEDKKPIIQTIVICFNKETGEFVKEEMRGEELVQNQHCFLHCLGVKQREKILSKWEVS